MIQTSNNNEMAVAAYNGLFFVDLLLSNRQHDDIFSDCDLSVSKKEQYLRGEFVNKVLEYKTDLLVATIWDGAYFQLINRKKRQVVSSIAHPH